MGSALGLGMDWTIRSSVSARAQSVSLCLPSAAVSFNGTISSYGCSDPASCASLRFKSDQYRLALLLSVSTCTTSTTENHQVSVSSSNTRRMDWPSKSVGRIFISRLPAPHALGLFREYCNYAQYLYTFQTHPHPTSGK
jgi:hypothetical protein